MAITGFEYETWDKEQWDQNVALLKEQWQLKERLDVDTEIHDMNTRKTIKALVRHAPEVSKNE